MTPDDPTCGRTLAPGEATVVLCAEGACTHDPPHRPLPVLFLGDTDSWALTRWKLTDAERAAVAGGADLWLWHVGALPGHFHPLLPTFEAPRVGENCCPSCRHYADHTVGETLNRCQFCGCTVAYLKGGA